MQKETPGHRIRAKREQLGMSQAKLGSLVGLTERAINRLEVGTMPITSIDDHYLHFIATELRTTIEYILRGEFDSERASLEELYEMLKDGIVEGPEEYRRIAELVRESIKLRNKASIPLKRSELMSLLDVIRGADGY